MSKIAWALCVVTLAFGCGGVPADNVAVPTTSQPVEAPPKAAAILLGEWVMAPPPGQEREVMLVRFALATPPAVADFDAMRPDAREQEFFDNILRMRKEQPGSSILVSLQRKLDALDGVRVTFLADKLIATTPSGTDITRYHVEEDLGDRLVLLEEGTGPESERRKMVAFDGNDRMVLTIGATRVPMSRAGRGVVPRPNEVPSAPSADRGAVSPVPPSGNADYDSCVEEYYRCIDKMAPADRAAMSDLIAATKRIFAEAQGDPQRAREALASCRQAVKLAHATFCQ